MELDLFGYGHSAAYEHNGDRALMESLGLKTTGFGRDHTDIGTVVVEEARGGKPAATVKVEVTALPAQFFRFTVTRPCDDGDGTTAEVFVIRTGTGGFSEYWPMAREIARNMVNVTKVSE